jgi:transposase-like protein
MPNCPVCNEPHGQYLHTVVKVVGANRCRQLNGYRCTRCEYEWQVDHRPAESFRPFSTPDFELTAADAF